MCIEERIRGLSALSGGAKFRLDSDFGMATGKYSFQPYRHTMSELWLKLEAVAKSTVIQMVSSRFVTI